MERSGVGKRKEAEIVAALGDLPVRTLYACESGSRAWGFASADSDWDVRFVYAHPRDAYLSIERPSETIDLFLPGKLDLAGWDLRKALGLLRKSNPSLLEWLHSPIVYRAEGEFLAEMRDLAGRAFSPNAGLHHYRSMAASNLATHLALVEANLKRYLYVLRPVLAARWIERTGRLAPVAFAELLGEVPPERRDEVDELLARKAAASERDGFAGLPGLHAWMGAEVARLGEVRLDAPPPLPTEDFDAILRRWIAPIAVSRGFHDGRRKVDP